MNRFTYRAETERARGSDNNLCMIGERRLNSLKLPKTHKKMQEGTVSILLNFVTIKEKPDRSKL